MTAIDDIKNGKAYILGVIAFASAVGAFLTQVLHFAPEPTLLSIAGFAVMFLVIAWLIQRSEERQSKALKAYETASDGQMKEIMDSLTVIKDMTIENQRSSIRLEMNSYIRNQPYNHDTILAYAEKYFIDLKGDWKETDVFLSWIDAEDEAGRKVHVPPALLANVNTKKANESA